MTPGVSSSSSTNADAGASAPSDPNAVNKNMFLQLLVAQIKNQDPLNPADGVQFLAQLAQFTQLEQTQNMSGDLAAIRNDVDRLASQLQSQTETQS